MYPRRIASVSVLVAVVVVALAGVAHADDTIVPTPPAGPPGSLAMAQAKAHYQAGAQLYQHGDFAGAAPEFVEAWRLSGKSDLLYNAAVCYENLHQDREALAYYQAYLQYKPQATDAAAVQAKIDSLRATLPPAPASAPAAATVTPPASMSTAPASTSVPAPAPSPVASPLPAASSATSAAETVGPNRTPFWIAAGAGAACLAFGATSFAFANAANSALHNYPGSRQQANEDVSSANRDATIGWVLVGAAGAAAITAGVLYYRENHEAAASSTEVSAAVLPAGGYVAVSGGF